MFDAAIGNVPFGDFKVVDKRYDKLNFLIHDYFFAKTIDKVRPGGVLAFITLKKQDVGGDVGPGAARKDSVRQADRTNQVTATSSVCARKVWLTPKSTA